MTITAVDVTTIESIGHREGVDLGAEEYRRFANAIGSLAPDDWSRPTNCEGWTVRELAGHVLGAMRSAASFPELRRQQKEIKHRAKADGGNEVDHMTALQVELTAGLTVGEVVEECETLVGPAARGRRRTPAPIRRFAKIPVEIGSIAETWTIGYLVDIILTRDIWMHRADLAEAVGAEMELDAVHDGRIVADIVAEWARRHGRPFELHLTGAAGGRYVAPGADAERIEIDAVEFCLALSGRRATEGLLAQEVPF